MSTPGITIQGAKDLGLVTLQSFDQAGRFAVALKHTSHPLMDAWTGRGNMKGHRKIVEQGGDRLTRSITLGTTGNAKQVHIYQETTENVVNIQKEIIVDWTHGQTSLTYERRELKVNSMSSRQIANLFKIRNTNMYVEFADHLEKRAWFSPNDSSDDLNPHGIPTWLPIGSNNEEGYVSDAYNYADTGTANAGGIDATVNTRWKSYYSDFDSVNDTFLERLGRAFRKTYFKSPKIATDLVDGPMSMFGIYTNDNIISAYETLARKSDDQVGADLGKYCGNTAFKRRPLEYVDMLDSGNADSTIHGTDPIYGINHNYFEIICLEGDNFVRQEPMNDVKTHNIFTVFVDVTYQFICTDRQKCGFVLAKT